MKPKSMLAKNVVSDALEAVGYEITSFKDNKPAKKVDEQEHDEKRPPARKGEHRRNAAYVVGVSGMT